MTDRLLTPKETAETLCVQLNTLSVWRSTRRGGPDYIKCGRAVRYAESAVREYLQRRTVRVESDLATAGISYPAINPSDLVSLAVPIPSLDEQRAIAAFLDRETARIDELIAKKQRLIELLAEKRTALISHAVTKGLNPDAPMKDSGVEWIRSIPEHWDVRRLKFAFHFLNNMRVPISGEERASMAKEYPYYGASGIIDHVDGYIFDEPLILVAEDGANLYSRSSPLAFIVRGQYWVNNHAHILRPDSGPITYWEAVLQTVEYDPWVTGSAQPKLTKENLGEIPLPLPPLQEQNRIARFIEAAEAGPLPLVDRIRNAVEHLREYRSALISAAVTGKIDVRGEVADL